MTQPLKIALILSSTRPTRLADKPAQWFLEFAQKNRPDMSYELLDLRDFDLPFFDEVASNAWAPSQSAAAVAWQKKLAEFDGYIFVTAEYNHSITGALKNALDQSYVEWAKKPMGAVGYGGVGAARAIEHLRAIAVELQMVPVRNAVHIGGGDFMAISPMGQDAPMSEIEGHLAGSAKALLDDIAWWGAATKAARG
ncbi:MAG: NAD(P)H-dependent oxidoreductase [Paracoccaceae bacterium]|nr:NAD(P)H-dependent oxidoreductase [Paracoccaceae bacterium]